MPIALWNLGNLVFPVMDADKISINTVMGGRTLPLRFYPYIAGNGHNVIIIVASEPFRGCIGSCDSGVTSSRKSDVVLGRNFDKGSWRSFQAKGRLSYVNNVLCEKYSRITLLKRSQVWSRCWTVLSDVRSTRSICEYLIFAGAAPVPNA